MSGANAPLPPLTPPQVALGPAVPLYVPPQALTAEGWQAPPPLTNPLIVPVVDRDFTWDQIVDIVDDYFKIEREERVRQTGEILTEGRIDTFPQTAATIFEPWRGDSVGFNERWLSTLQSYRRMAQLRVIPVANGYQIEIQVLRELENLPRPMHATAGSATFRHDTSPERRTEPEPILGREVGDDPRPVANAIPALGWIPEGRDPALENVILGRISRRLNETAAAVRGGRLVPTPDSNPIFTPPPLDTTPSLLTPGGSTTVPGLPPSGAHIGLPADPR
jgi:hypothetical protein